MNVTAMPQDKHNSNVPILPRAIKAPPPGQARIAERAIPTMSGTLADLFNGYAPLAYYLPWEILDYVELLATWNPDYSQAVDNIRTLANSGHELFVDASREGTAQRIKDKLEEKARVIQHQHGGVDGLVDKLLDQAATYGAMCGEWIVSEDLDDVVDFEDINPKHIRFRREGNRWMPYQKLSGAQVAEARARGREVLSGNMVALNPTTFLYYAFDAAPGSPYGTPPFVAALGNISIQRDMVHNMSQIVKKVGLLGIVDITIKQLQKRPAETDEAYAARATQYLASYVEVVEEMVQNGGIIHYDDVEAQTYNISGNAAGATNIFKQNEELIFSGLKSMPSVQGRSYSTTETYAGVAYDIIIRNTKKYQRSCKRVIEYGYWLMMQLQGEQPKSIAIRFNENKTLHRMQDAQAEAVEIKNGLVMWVCGLIDQLGFAQRLGISSPKKPMDEPPQSDLIGNAVASGDATPGSGGAEGSPRSDDMVHNEVP